MSKALDITDFISMSVGLLTLDVRSPAEYKKGHIHHALNLPLFTDEERARVGTLYKQKSRNEAIEAGLEMVGPKMVEFVRFVKPLAKHNKIFVHCWRGGMRSGSMAWLLDMMGYEVYTLRDGYKAYRALVLETLARDTPYIILGGRTGSGKTQVLHTLREKNEQIIDLERLANHKGSSFGALGEPPQPSTEQFENDIYLAYSKLDPTKPIWLEDESRNVGSCYIPHVLWERMRRAPVVAIELPFEVRVKRLVKDYGEAEMTGLKEAIIRIERRLGNEATKEALAQLDARDLAQVARITLRYYDKAYDFGLTNRLSRELRKFDFETDDMEAIAQSVIDKGKCKIE